jgi:hypothetical protein
MKQDAALAPFGGDLNVATVPYPFVKRTIANATPVRFKRERNQNFPSKFAPSRMPFIAESNIVIVKIKGP